MGVVRGVTDLKLSTREGFKFYFKLPWPELGGTEIRCCICCEEDDDEEEDEVAFAAPDRGQPSVPGAERGRELVAL